MLRIWRNFGVAGILCILTGIGWSAPVCAAESATVADDSVTLKVMTFNIRNGTTNDEDNSWDFRRESAFKLIRTYDPDILGLQEPVRFQLDEIQRAFPGYREVGVGRIDGGTFGEYNAILFRESRFSLLNSGRFWFSDTPDIPGTRNWGNAPPRICTWVRLQDKSSRRSFYVYNVHFDRVSSYSRVRSAMLLARSIHERNVPADPVILLGDFGVGEKNEVIRYLERDASLIREGKEEYSPVILYDTFRRIHPDAVLVGTFNNFKGVRNGEKLDDIFVTAGIIVIDADIITDQVDGRYPSNHFPVTAVLKIGSDNAP